MNHQHKKGFTLAEMLIVVSIVAILSSVVFIAFNRARMNARDIQRMVALDSFKGALSLYYRDHGKYPNADSKAPLEGFSYLKHNGAAPTYCNLLDYYDQGVAADSIRLDNSASPGFIKDLFNEGYIGLQDWNDPSNPTSNSNLYNCRYIVPETEALNNNVQHYFLHCNLEANSAAEVNDGGLNNTVYEIMAPSPWICLCGQNGKGGGSPVPPMPSGGTCPQTI